jgi:uncharacterized membrane protein YraQ (UPF0718 family)
MIGPDPLTILYTILGVLTSIDWPAAGLVVSIIGGWIYVLWLLSSAHEQRAEILKELRQIAGKLDRIADKLDK